MRRRRIAVCTGRMIEAPVLTSCSPSTEAAGATAATAMGATYTFVAGPLPPGPAVATAASVERSMDVPPTLTLAVALAV